jgi:hypothetical protein
MKRTPASPHQTIKESTFWPTGPGGCMKNFCWWVAGFCAAAAGIIVWGPKRVKPVEELAHRLEDAWSNHHTIA